MKPINHLLDLFQQWVVWARRVCTLEKKRKEKQIPCHFTINTKIKGKITAELG